MPKLPRSINWLLTALGIALALMGISGMFLASETAPVSAVAVTARVESTVNVNCDSQPSVRVSFAWTGGRQVEDYYNAPCDRTYRKGEAIRAFVASNDRRMWLREQIGF